MRNDRDGGRQERRKMTEVKEIGYDHIGAECVRVLGRAVNELLHMLDIV